MSDLRKLAVPIVAAVLLLLVTGLSVVSAATLQVPSEYATIQAAIDAAGAGAATLPAPAGGADGADRLGAWPRASSIAAWW